MPEIDLTSRPALKLRRKQWISEHRNLSESAGRELTMREFLIAAGSLRPGGYPDNSDRVWTEFRNRDQLAVLRLRPLSPIEREISSIVDCFNRPPKGYYS